MKTALALVEGPDHVCYRYRVKAFLPSLSRRFASFPAIPIESNPIRRLIQFATLDHVDTILIQRKLLSRPFLKLLRRATDHLIFDFDDAVFQRDSYDRRGAWSKKRFSRFRDTIQEVDTVIAGNDFLADAALKAGARANRVEVVPTCIDMDHYPATALVKSVQDTSLELVWIGSSSTLQGIESRRDLLERIAQEIPGTRTRIICDRFPDLGTMPIKEVPWSKASEAEDIAAADVGITWIPNDPWSRGKCGLKLLQYQAAGLPVVANPVGVHSEMILNGQNGFLASTDDEWIAALKSLALDPIRRMQMGRAARTRVEREYSVDAWKETFGEILEGPAESYPSDNLKPSSDVTRPNFARTLSSRPASRLTQYIRARGSRSASESTATHRSTEVSG